MAPEFKPPDFGEKPREESPGEARQRYADLIRTVTGFMGIELGQYERDKLGRFITQVVAQLTPEQQKALAELAGKLLAWAADRYGK